MGNLLENIRSAEDVKQLDPALLGPLCQEMREAIIRTVSDNGGHLASNLGVVELTVALCLAFVPLRTPLFGMWGTKAIPISC